MNYAILRTQKLKHLASVRRSLKHAFREQDTPNADAELTPQNTHIGANSADEGMTKIAALLPEKRRSDAVLAIEYLITASPEVMHNKDRQTQDAYFQDALDWLKTRHGAENIVYAGIHRDETTPHMYAYVVPIDAATGRLNAKKWLGGAKALSQMQTEFADSVGQKHGLERGIEGSKAKHQTVRQFYSQIEKPVKEVRIGAEYLKPRVLKKGLLTSKHETPEQIAERLTNAVKQAYAPAVEKARKTDTERRRAEEMEKTAQGLSRQLKNVQKQLQEHETHLSPVIELAKLSKLEFVQMIQHAHKRVQEIAQTKAEATNRQEIEIERQRRITDLPRVERATAGASCTFAQHALAAIKRAGGLAERVDWSAVERSAAIESIRENRQNPRDVLAVIVRYSPGMADPARQEQARTMVSATAGKDVAPTKAKGRDIGPTL